jgi:hypothetical protein
MTDRYIVYGAAGSGSVIVEAALTLLGLSYQVVESAPYDKPEDAEALAALNPMRQAPAPPSVRGFAASTHPMKGRERVSLTAPA